MTRRVNGFNLLAPAWSVTRYMRTDCPSIWEDIHCPFPGLNKNAIIPGPISGRIVSVLWYSFVINEFVNIISGGVYFFGIFWLFMMHILINIVDGITHAAYRITVLGAGFFL